jgi:hypothetical protein
MNSYNPYNAYNSSVGSCLNHLKSFNTVYRELVNLVDKINEKNCESNSNKLLLDTSILKRSFPNVDLNNSNWLDGVLNEIKRLSQDLTSNNNYKNNNSRKKDSNSSKEIDLNENYNFNSHRSFENNDFYNRSIDDCNNNTNNNNKAKILIEPINEPISNKDPLVNMEIKDPEELNISNNKINNSNKALAEEKPVEMP